MAPITVPPSLKKIKVFLTRATELDRDASNPESRVVAYNCRQYAVLSGIPLAGSDPDAMATLGELLGQLESEKAAMAVFSKEEHWKISRKVADRVFEKADGEDRGGQANKGTAKSFYAAGTFYEILQQFYDDEREEKEDDGSKELRVEEEQRRIYCKWKATEILNAIKEGRTPAPGGYQQEEEAETGATSDEYPMPPNASDNDPANTNGGVLSSIAGLPAAPSMPSSDFFNGISGGNAETNTLSEASDAQHDFGPNGEVSPPPYNGIELNLNGDPTPIVEDVDDDSGAEDIFIPGGAEKGTENVINMFVDHTPTPPVPPPPYPDQSARATTHVTFNNNPSIPPPAATRPLPPPVAPSSNSTNNSNGMLSTLFGKSNSKKKLSKAEMADAVELTKFALAALQQGDGEMGKERLEQALGIWRSASTKTIGSVSSLIGRLPHSKYNQSKQSDIIELTEHALTALKKGDGDAGRKRLDQALAIFC